MKSFVSPFRQFIQRALIVLSFFGIAEMGWGQTSIQNFGTITGSNTSQTASTSLIANPTSGTSYARAGATAPNAPVVLATTSNPLGTSGAYCRSVASSSASVTKMSPIVSYTSGLEFYTSFKVLFGDASASNTATSGVWTFYQGIQGTNYTDNTDVSSANNFTALRFTFGASGNLALTYNNSGTYNSTSLTTSSLSQATVLTIEIVGNNKSSGTINYTYNGNSQSVAVQKFDLYVNGVLIGNDLNKGGATSNSNINSLTWTGVSSTSNVANLFLDDVIVYNTVPSSIGTSNSATPPALTAASSPTVDGAFDVTFTDDSAWRTAISSITIGGTTLTAGYSVTAGKITFTPSASVPAGLLQSAGSKAIVVNATGYSTASVTQALGAGSASKLVVSTQPAAPTANGGALATQPAIAIQDQYGNATTSTASVSAAVGVGAWTLGGTSSVSGVAGTATFSGLTATSAAAVTGATITFSSAGLTSVTSSAFNIPAPAPANDNCNGAIDLTVNANATSGTFIASTPMTNATKNDVFYSFTPTISGSHTITINGYSASGDKDVYIYSVCPSTYSTSTDVVVSGTGTSSSSESATASFNAGTSYKILVQDYGSSGGTFNIRVTSPLPTISTSGTLSSVNTTYGSASASPTNFNVSGANMSAGILVTPPVGFEVSLSPSSGYASTVTLGAAGTIASTPVYVRLTAAAAVGTYSGNIVLSSTGATNVNVATASSAVSAKALTISGLSAANKNYDGNTAVSVTGTAAYSGLVNSESFSVTGSVSWAFPDANVGTNKNLTRTGSYNTPSDNYTVTQPTLTANIAAVPLTITGITANDKSFDGTTTATLSGTPTYSGLVNGESYAVSGTPTANFEDATVGNNKTVIVTGYSIPTNNYSLTQPTLMANILAPSNPTIAINGSPASVNTTYGTASTSPTSFTVSGSALTADITITPPSGYEVSTSLASGYSASLALTPSSGTINTTTVYLRLASTTAAGTYSGNIVASSNGASDGTLATSSSAVSKKALSITSPTIASRVYNGATAAGDATVGTLSGFIGTETLTVTGVAAAYSSANVGTYNSVAITYTLADGTNGGLASNYSLANGSATGQITAKALSISNPSIASKVYDGNSTSGTVTTGNLSGFVGSETVTASAAGTYADANVAAGKTATIVYTLANGANGGLATNYSLSNGSATGDITAKALTITSPTIASKVYDGTVIAGTLTVGTLSGLVGTQTLTVTGSAANYSSANVGTYNSVVITYTLSNGANGGLASNYSLINGSATGQITAKSLSISAPSIASKVYDGNSSAGTLTIGTLSGTIGVQTLTVSGAAANYSSSNVGSYSSTITYTLGDGTGLASNYSLANGSATGYITAKDLSVTTATIASKAYDGSTISGAVTAGNVSGFVGTETAVVSSATGVYADANVGTGKTATITYVLGNGTNGGLAANYSLATTSATGDITQGTTLITFNSLPSKQIGEAAFACGASTNFGSLTYSSSNTAVATINSTGIITIVGVGVSTITASVTGNSNYTSASTSLSFTVSENTYYYRSVGNGNWNNAATWQSSSATNGTWATPTIAPGATNSVFIQSGHTITLTQNESVNDLHIASGTGSALGTRGVIALGANTLSVNGKLRDYYGSVGSVPGTSQNGGYSAYPFTATTGKVSIVGNSRTVFTSGEWGATVTTASANFPLEINMNFGETAIATTSIKCSNLNVVSGTLEAIIIGIDNGVSGQGDVTIASGAIIRSSATSQNVFQRTTTTLAGILTVNGTLVLTGPSPTIQVTSILLNGTVEYAKNGAQTLLVVSANGGAIPNNYKNLTFSGSGIKTLGVNTTVNGTLTLAGTASLALNSKTLTYGGSSTLEYAGSSAQTTSTAAELSVIPSTLKVNNSNGVTLNSNLEVTNLDIIPSSSLIVPSNNTLTVSGTITNAGTLDILSGGQLLQTSDTDISGGGQCIFRKDLPLQPNSALAGYNRSYYIGSPVVGSTSTTPVNITSVLGSSTTGLNMYGYTESNNSWPLYYSGTEQISNSTFDIGKGYFVNSSSGTYFSQANFTGNSFNNGPVTVTLTNTAGQGGGYNLISNPYPSGINWSDIYNDASNTSLVSSSYWLRTYQDGAGMTYKTCNASGVSTQGLNTIISPATGFWVKYTGTSPGTFTFKNAMRTSGAGTYYTMNANRIIRLDLGNGTYDDQAVVYLNEDAGLGIESYDSDKRIPSTTVHQLYSLEGTTKLAINGFNNALAKDTVLLGMQIPTAGTYTINASQIDATIEEDIFLEDKVTGAYQNLKTTPSYSFTSTQGTFNNRFVLHFAPFVPALPGQTAATAIAMPTSNWPQCNNVTTEDQWHAFTATSEGISIEVNTASTDIVIELQDGTGNVVAQENAVNGIGNETLNFFGLTAGQTYKVGVRNNISSQPTGTYGICVKSLKRGGCDYGAGPYSLCQYYKATWAGSTGVSYTFTFTGTSGPAEGQTFTRTQNSDICVLSTVTPLLPYGSTYDVVISNTYTLTDGAGNTEQITVPSNSGCQVVTIAQPQTTLSNSSSCNNGARFRGAVVSSMPWVCGANNWRWRFTEVNPLTMQEVGLPIELNRGSASNYLSLGTVAQLQNGKTYAVQTAPMFTYTGTNYNWGPTQYLCIVGAANVTQDATQDAMQDPSEDAAQEAAQGSNKLLTQDSSQENDVLIYSTSDQQIKVWTSSENTELTNTTVRIYNSTGSLVYTQRMNSNEMIIDLNTAAGLYIVEVGSVKRRVLISPLAP